MESSSAPSLSFEPSATNGRFTVEDVKSWIDAMSKRGIYGGESARLRTSALTQIVSVLGPEELNDIRVVLADVEELGKRFARLKNAKPETVNTYVTRTRQTLADFLRYQADPTGFKIAGAGGSTAKSSKDATKRKSALPKAKDKQASPQEPSPLSEARNNEPLGALPQPKPGQAQPQWRSFPLEGEGQELIYALPSGGIVMRDVMKFVIHLATLAKDFDPFNNPKQAQVFSLVRSVSE